MKNALHLLMVAAVISSSCKKEEKSTGLPPVANAGPDQQFASIPDSVILNGSASNNTGGNISAYQWRQISGPSTPAHILNSSSVRTVVKNFSTGAYQFELRVTGNGGLYAMDTVQIQISQEYILSSIWKYWTDPFEDQNYISIDPSNSFSIATMALTRVEVSIQLDSSSLWNVALPWDWHGGNPEPINNRYFWYFLSFPYYNSPDFIIASNPSDYKFSDKPVKVKVKFY
jgi:hypothetical protein